MLTGGRLQAAIEVLEQVLDRYRPATEALKEWGHAHRFAGSGDRAAIGNLVFDALRNRASLAHLMGEDTPRALIVGAFLHVWGNTVEHLDVAIAGDRHAPRRMSDAERIQLRTATLDDAPDWVRADVPQWLEGAFAESFGAAAVAEGRALAARAPIDLRVNTLKATRDKLAKALQRFAPQPTPISPTGLRIAAPKGPARAPNVQADAAFAKGWFELQDEGSQVATLACEAAAGQQVADICAGAGGKTLALSALMANKGQVHAYDADRGRLKGIFERLRRAGTRNVQVIEPGTAPLDHLHERIDVVLVDAPCSGSGVWRRRPDAKWRLSAEALDARMSEQAAVLDAAVPLVKPGGRIVYVTCSVLGAENGGQVDAFLSTHPAFAPRPVTAELTASIAANREKHGEQKVYGQQTVNGISSRESSLQLTPLRDSTDGFFIAVLERREG